MDTPALEGTPELYRQALDALTAASGLHRQVLAGLAEVAGLLRGGATEMDVTYAFDAFYRLAAAMEDGAGKALADQAAHLAEARRLGIIEGRRQLAAEIAGQEAPAPRLTLAPTG